MKNYSINIFWDYLIYRKYFDSLKWTQFKFRKWLNCLGTWKNLILFQVFLTFESEDQIWCCFEREAHFFLLKTFFDFLVKFNCYRVFINAPKCTFLSIIPRFRKKKYLFNDSLLCSLMQSLERVSDFFLICFQITTRYFIFDRFQECLQQFTAFWIYLLGIKES